MRFNDLSQSARLIDVAYRASCATLDGDDATVVAPTPAAAAPGRTRDVVPEPDRSL